MPFERMRHSIRRWRLNVQFPAVNSLEEFCQIIRGNEWAPRTNYCHGTMDVLPSETGLSAVFISLQLAQNFTGSETILFDDSFPVKASFGLSKIVLIMCEKNGYVSYINFKNILIEIYWEM